MSDARGKLAVKVDGEPLAEAEARAFWERFSAHMEANKGDLAGFAKAEGLASVHPSMEGGRPVLLASKTAAQRAYVSVEKGSGSSGGSSGHQGGGRGPSKPQGKPGKPSKRR